MLPIAVSMGEPAGIGPEIIVKAHRTAGAPPFCVFGDAAHFETLGAKVARIACPRDAAAIFADRLPVIDIPLTARPAPGAPDARNARAVIAAIDAAYDACLKGEAAALVTAPINKAVLYAAGFSHPGHTEYLAAKAKSAGGTGEHLMLLAGGGLRIALVTIHVPLNKVSALLTSELIVAKGALLAAGLARDFGLAGPRIAVAALNPHGGEAGALGREEIEIIAPAVAALRARGITASGPHPADTLFHAGARARYDAVLAMYHDQALIPVKTLDFAGGVNATLGLPIVRTSPDHGTAFDIAGQGSADPSSFIAALALAGEMAAHRARAR